MRIVFLDDSGQADPPRPGLGRLQALGAAIFPEGAVAGYTRAMAAIKDDLGIPPEEEIKWNPDRTKSPVFASSDGNLVAEVRRRMLKEAIMRHVRTVVVIVDHHQALEGPSAAQAGMKILKWLYERVSMHLGDNHDFGIMIADKPGGGHREESRWLGETLRLTSDGTRYVRANKIVLPIVTAESRYVPHLQLADNLYNLLYWCFGESIWAMPSTKVRLSLPFADWPYSIDDGLGTCGSESAHGQAPLDAS
jgi:hypothetical protein